MWRTDRTSLWGRRSLYGGRAGAYAAVLADPLLERDQRVAHRLYELAAPHVVEMALLVKERGHPLIAITSTRHTTQMPSSPT